MTTTSEPTNGTALAVREFSDKQILTRIKAASEVGFGLAGATATQQNMIYLLARHYDVDPAIDITLFRGVPMFTIDGRVRLMRRHPQYRGYSTRPLSKDEKEAWGYKPEEIVVECTIRTKDWGEITARGKVSPDEFGRQPVAKSHPQEMAEKRAISRTSRMAFGQDVPDEDEVGYIIEERNDPARVALQAADYSRIHGSDDDGTAFADQPVTTSAASLHAAEPARASEAPNSGARGPATPRTVSQAGHPLWTAYTAAEAAAQAEGIEVPELNLPQPEDVLRASTATLLEMVEQKRAAG